MGTPEGGSRFGSAPKPISPDSFERRTLEALQTVDEFLRRAEEKLHEVGREKFDISVVSKVIAKRAEIDQAYEALSSKKQLVYEQLLDTLRSALRGVVVKIYSHSQGLEFDFREHSVFASRSGSRGLKSFHIQHADLGKRPEWKVVCDAIIERLEKYVDETLVALPALLEQESTNLASMRGKIDELSGKLEQLS